ncbi:MAG: hypothetical protein WDN25_30200 [Acetobacteraceae bacterium]
MSDDARQAARNAWTDQQMAAAVPRARTMRETIATGIASGFAAATSTLIVSLIRWAVQHFLASG